MKDSLKHIIVLLYNIIISLLISISSIYILTFLLLRCTFIYKIYSSKTRLSDYVYADQSTIYKNYKIIADFISYPSIKKFSLPDFDISHNAMIHFYDVKNIVNTLLLITIFTLSILVLQLIISSVTGKHLSLCFLAYVPIELIIFCSILVISFIVNFKKCFVLFHKLLFRNDFWLFDPKIDTVINILPEDFFLMAALIILSFLIIESIIMLFVRHHIIKNHSDVVLRLRFFR